MTKLEQYVLTASKNGQTVDSEQFVKSFENILSKAKFFECKWYSEVIDSLKSRAFRITSN